MRLRFIAHSTNRQTLRRKNTSSDVLVIQMKEFFPTRRSRLRLSDFGVPYYEEADLWRPARCTTHIDEIKRNKELNQPSSKCSTLRHRRMNEWRMAQGNSFHFSLLKHQNKYVFSGQKVTKIFFANRKLLNVAAVAVRIANEQNTNIEQNEGKSFYAAFRCFHGIHSMVFAFPFLRVPGSRFFFFKFFVF